MLAAKAAQRSAAGDVLPSNDVDRDRGDKSECWVAGCAGDGGTDISGVGAGSVLDGEGGGAVTGGKSARGYCEEVE